MSFILQLMPLKRENITPTVQHFTERFFPAHEPFFTTFIGSKCHVPSVFNFSGAHIYSSKFRISRFFKCGPCKFRIAEKGSIHNRQYVSSSIKVNTLNIFSSRLFMPLKRAKSRLNLTIYFFRSQIRLRFFFFFRKICPPELRGRRKYKNRSTSKSSMNK